MKQWGGTQLCINKRFDLINAIRSNREMPVGQNKTQGLGDKTIYVSQRELELSLNDFVWLSSYKI